MKLNDVKVLTQQMIAQSMGETYMTQHGYLEGIPADKLVDVGKDVLDTDQTTEKATKALCVLLAKREIDEGDFNPMFKDILVDRVEWGGFIERDKIDYADIMDDPVMNVTNGTDYSAIEHKYYQPKVISKIYEEGKAIMIPISISRAAMTEAFKGWDEMNSFISKIRNKVRMTLAKALDRYGAVLVESAIVVSTKATETAIYLLDDAEADGVTGITSTTTPEEAMNNKDFILYVAKRIAEVRDNMKADTTAYNNGNWSTSTSEGNSLLYLLTKFTRSLKFDVKSGLFNREDVGFGDYKSIPMWQAVKENNANPFTWDSASTVSFSADATNKLGIGTSAVEINNCLGVVFNKKALGMTVFKEYTTTSYTACADFWNEFVHSLTNQLLDSDYPIVAFLVDRKGKAE